MKNTILKLTNELNNAQPLDVEKTEALIDDSTNASAVDCAAASMTCMEISNQYKEFATRLNREALDRASSKGLTCDYTQAEFNAKGELLMWEENNPANKYWVKVFPNGDWFNVKKANKTLRNILFEALNLLSQDTSRSSSQLAKDIYNIYFNNHLFKFTFDWDYNKLNDLKANNSLPVFIKSNETTNLYSDWTLFGPRAAVIKEDDIRDYDGSGSLFKYDITFII